MNLKSILAAIWRFFFSAKESSPGGGGTDPGGKIDPSPSEGDPAPPSPPPPVPPGGDLVVLPGVRDERERILPAAVEGWFTPGPAAEWEQNRKAHFAWVRVGRFRGGSVPTEPDGFAAEIGVRILGGASPQGGKVKAIGPGVVDEQRYGAPWQEGVPMFFRLEVHPEGAKVTVGAGTTPVEIHLGRRAFIGIGCPPETGGRPGAPGTFSGVKWS